MAIIKAYPESIIPNVFPSNVLTMRAAIGNPQTSQFKILVTPAKNKT